MKKSYIVLFVLLLILTPLSLVGASGDESGAKKADSNDRYYEIYPLPQHEKDLGTDFTITEEVNVVVGDSIDKPTTDFLKEILESKSLEINISDQVVSGKTNILVGTEHSGGYVTSYIKENVTYDETVFEKIDPYVLTMDKKLEDKGTIAILGKDSDAAYYGLASLKMILDRIPNRNIHSMLYEDFSDTKRRGFIEGFYGFPWSHESRISLMQYGGQLKMNTYIFGPKDDPYHNRKWRELYPEDKLAKIAELAQVGSESKVDFVWAIHPGFNMINWDKYDQELDTLLAKLDQLYSAGVRQFGLFMDDINTTKALQNREKHVKLITDVSNWVQSKGDVKPLIYTPPFYNQAWTGNTGKPYLKALSNTPENVEIMWTGSGVFGTVNPEDMAWPKQFTEREPFVWLNWPVNDYVNSGLFLGKGEVLKEGTHNIAGLVTNPMEHAELSKIALFAVADYAWNVDDFHAEQSWKDSFKYVAPNADSELQIIASHLSSPSTNRGYDLEESEYIKEELKQFKQKFKADEPVDEIGTSLIDEFNRVLDAIEGFKEKSTNEQMLKEIKPWLNSLREIVQADKHAVKSVLALQNEDVNLAWKELGKATGAMKKSQTYTVPRLNASDITVEAGAKRLIPFADKLISQLQAQIVTAIDPDATANIPITSYERQDMGKMVDGDEETYAYVKIIQENGDWYGIDLGKKVNVDNIRILQGRNNGDHDIFQRGVLEYSVDGENWKAIGDERSGYLIEEKDLNVEARYVRYRLTHAGVPGGKPDLWTAVREFTVNTNKSAESVYTNVEALKDTEIEATERSAKISDLSDITLKPGQYIGISLQTIRNIKDIALKSTNSKLSLEVSNNGVEWEEITTDSFPNFAYVRLINNTENGITFDLSKLLVKKNAFAEPVVTHNYPNIYAGEIGNVYDGDLNSKVWFGGMQNKGRYVQVDMGGTVDVHNVAVVIDEEEGDYFRKGELQVSTDGETWKTIHTFDHPESRSGNFPDHESPFRYKRVKLNDAVQARYIRLISTEDANKWLALNEIIVNEGSLKPGTDDLTIEADPQGVDGHEAWRVKDQKLSTYYMPAGNQGTGSLNYKLTKGNTLEDVILLQNPDHVSNADVLIRDKEGWHQAGQLSKAMQTIDVSSFEHVLEIKLEWKGATIPQIHEIIPVEKQVPDVDSVQDIKALVKQFANDGAFEDEQAVHALTVHLTAVYRYEKQENATKVVKHMKGFKTLLDYQKENQLIGEKAYETLSIVSDSFIEQWQ
ncbi:hypothetical protein GCM10009001_04640 [Virgibacillus siamensis]|uniref:Hyaluronoglucosaminidase n=1 Tax=Virgibacillus siamensis TaxID=480071 RepID=A0ABN1FIM3_9BACI